VFGFFDLYQAVQVGGIPVLSLSHFIGGINNGFI